MGNAAPAGFTEATVSEAVNIVEVLAEGGARAARLQDRVTFRDVVRTGVKSRAELTFPDATLARVGANSVFSFRPDQRAFDLKQGCILFHSPKGKGGGQIHTAAATAAVTGTTIIVATTPNGGFKVLVLEGRARLRMANGQVSNLRAGQMAYVLPGAKRISPPLSFHLSEQVKGSDLVRGFSAPLPSIPLIDAAIIQQQIQIQQGDLNVTGFMIGEVTGDNTVNLVPVSAPIVSTTENPGSPFVSAAATSTPVPPPPPSRYDYALANDSVIDFSPVAPLDPLHTISPGELYDPLNYQALCAATMNQAGVAPDYPFYAGIGALNIDFNNPTLDLSAYDPGTVGNPPVQPNPDDPYSNPNGDFVFAAMGQLRIHGGLAVSGFSGEVDLFSHLAPVIDPGAVFSIASPASLGFNSDASLSLDNVQVYVPGGWLSFDTQMGLTINNSTFESMFDTDIWADSVDMTGASFQILGTAGTELHIGAQKTLSLNSVQVSVPGGVCLIEGGTGLTINNSGFQSMYNTELRADSVDVTGTSFQILDTVTPSMVHIDAYVNGAGGPVTLTDVTLNGARLDVDYSSAFTLSGSAVFDGSALRVNAKAIDVSGISFSPSLAELDLRQTDPWNLTSPVFSGQRLSVASASDLTFNLGNITGGEIRLSGQSSLRLAQTSVSQQNSGAPDLYLQSFGNIDIEAGSQIFSMAGIHPDGVNVTVANSFLSTDMDVGKGIDIYASGILTLNNADIRPRDTISLWAASIDSTGGTLQTSIGGIFADAGSGIAINGGSWSSAVNLQLSAPSISTLGLTASANQSIDFTGDTTLVQGGSLTTYDPLGVGVWVRGNTAATVDGATISSARDANVHGGQISLINATINVNNTDPMPQIFVNGSGPVSIQGSTLVGTGPVNVQGLTLDLINGQITSGATPGYNQISLMATDPAGLLNVNGTVLASQQIRMQADTIRLENINFPNGSMVDLDCRLGILAPNANTRATIMPGAVNYYDGVKYGGTLLDNAPHPNINIH